MSPWKTVLKALAVAMAIYPLPGTPTIQKSLQVVDVSQRDVGQCPNITMGTVTNSSSQFGPPFSTALSLSVPASSDLVFFESRGSYDNLSSITFELSDNKDTTDIIVNVAIGFYNNATLDLAKVCLLQNAGGKGVGFFTPFANGTAIPFDDKVTFTVTVILPNTGSTLNINALKTNMGIWFHHITSLGNGVIFGSLSFNTTDAPIQSDSVSAVVANFTTVNAEISGSYNISDSLGISTINAPIFVNILMENADGDNPTTLSLETEDGAIQAPITLVSTSTSGSPAAFSVSAITTNNPLNVSFPDTLTSPFARLAFIGRNLNGLTNVTLPATYEGSILLSTSISHPTLTSNPNTTDPSGQGRTRTVDSQILPNGSLSAQVQWGNDTGSGTVVVTTEISPNTVHLL
ncbi:hypothetical protein K439DRAFT_1626286 [Ramaria rubella]|nr:hypothetical protein K439DRAFT_1626286 [Ramaria rubella]